MNNLEIDLAKIKMQPQEFEKLITEVANDKSWCAMNKIDYINPNFLELKEKLYQELIVHKG
jgi:hypothetical protein